MNFNLTQREATVAASIVCCLLNGCAHDHSEKAVYGPIEPTHSAPGTQVITASTNLPLSYQWYFTNGNPPGATPAVPAVGGTNAVLYYQWYKNTNP